MKVSEAIDRADQLRPNPLFSSMKRHWLHQLESELAEMMGVDIPDWENEEDPELLLGEPQAELYPIYLTPYIDYALEETDRYQMDTIMSNQYLSSVKAWIRRNNWHPEAGTQRFTGVFQ